jgi:hypothetical protein
MNRRDIHDLTLCFLREGRFQRQARAPETKSTA